MGRFSRRLRKSGAWALVSCALGFYPIPTHALQVTVTLCGNGCICIDYDYGSGSYVEVRCEPDTGNWVNTPPGEGERPPDGPGSFGGSGTTKSLPNPLPGNPLTSQQVVKLNVAKNKAITKLRYYRIPDIYPPVNVPTTCSALFDNSPLGKTGVEILNEYSAFRNGEGVQNASGAKPCDNSSVGAWTTCCDHDRVVYLCGSFAGASTSYASTLLIHEALHVAGQMEDSSTTTGPGNPPTTNQLTKSVEAACDNPTPLY